MDNRLASRVLSALFVALSIAGCGGGGTPAGLITRAQGGTVAFGAQAKIVIPPNSLAQDTVITVAPFAGSVPAAPAGMAIVNGTIFDFRPSGTTFSPNATMTIAYDPALAANVDGSTLRICTVSGNGWQDVGGVIDPVAHTVTVSVSHFSVYAILGNLS